MKESNNKSVINKIPQAEISRFVPAKLRPCVYTYRHSDDCLQQGCPSHQATFSYRSVTDTFEMDFGDGVHVYLDSEQMDMVYDWIIRLRI